MTPNELPLVNKKFKKKSNFSFNNFYAYLHSKLLNYMFVKIYF
jgi:hypothetical protein